MMTPDDFRTWLRRLKLTQKQAAEALGMTTWQVERYLAGTTPIPRTTELAGLAIEQAMRASERTLERVLRTIMNGTING
jgi:predicted transcriptional regulator